MKKIILKTNSHLSNIQLTPQKQTYSIHINQHQSHTQINPNEIPSSIYDNNVPIKIRHHNFNHHNQSSFFQSLQYLRIQLITYNTNKSTQLNSTPNIKIIISDDDDYLFLWIATITESDFLYLKELYKLKIQFQGFSQLLTQHFGYLKSDKEINDQSAFFYGILDIGKQSDGKKQEEANLRIFQSNKFKQSLHLNLNFRQGSDEQIKKFLFERLMEEKQQNQQLRIQNSKLSNSLYAKMTEIQNMQARFKQQNQKTSQSIYFEQSQNRQKQHGSIEYNDLINNIQKAYISRFGEQKLEYSRQLQQLRQKFQEQRRKLVQQLTELQKSIKNKQIQLKDSEVRRIRVQSEYYSRSKETQLNKKNEELINEYIWQIQKIKKEKQEQIIRYKVNQEYLRKELQEKLQIIRVNSRIKQNQRCVVADSQSKVQQYKMEYQKLHCKYENTFQECMKAQAVLQQLRQKVRRKKQKIQQKKILICKLEQNKLKIQGKIVELQEQIVNMNNKNRQLMNELEEIRVQKDELRDRFKQMQRTIKQDNQLINHLNRQLIKNTVQKNDTKLGSTHKKYHFYSYNLKQDYS